MMELRRRGRNVALAVLYGAHSETDPELLAALADDDRDPDPPFSFDPADWPIQLCSPHGTFDRRADPLAAVPEPPPPPRWEREMLTESESREVRALFERERRERLRA